MSNMTFEQKLEYMRHHPWNFYYVDPAPKGTVYGSGYTHIMGVGTSDVRKTALHERHEVLDDIGSMINVMEIPSGWIGIDQYNYEMVDYMMDQLLNGYPDRWFVPRIHMEPPHDWMKQHPEELCVYWNGPTDPKEISEMVLHPQYFDSLGWDGNKPDLKVARQSFSSQIWLKDAIEALRHFIEHVENGPYGKQVLAYMPMIGNCGECMWWGDWISQGDPHKGDFGITHKKLFYEWCIEKYGDLDGLRKAWNMPDLTFETFRVPTPPERWSLDINEPYWTYWRDCQDERFPKIKNLRAVMLADDQRQVDCNMFHSKVCFDALESFGKLIKETTGKPAGAFYGYLQDPTVGYAGHCALTRAFETPWLDFYSSPKAYHYCLAGDPGGSQAPGQSFHRKKMWIEENDMRSWHAGTCYAPANESDTITCFWRELYRALTLKQGFWWMDIGSTSDDWFTDPVLVDMFKKQSKFYKRWSPIERERKAEILFVEDEQSCEHMTYLVGQQAGLRYKLERELKLCGAPVDHFLVDDLLDESFDLSQYKMVVFCHAFVMPRDQWDIIRKRLRPDVHLLWNYAAGILDPAFSLENQKYVTGFNVRENPDRLRHPEQYRHMYWHHVRLFPQDYPLLELVPEEGQTVLQQTGDGAIITATVPYGEGKSTYAADITLRTELLRKLVEDAGVTCYAPAHCTVLADDKLLGFFPRYDVQFTYTFDGTWRNVITGEIVSGNKLLAIREKKFEIFEKIDD